MQAGVLDGTVCACQELDELGATLVRDLGVAALLIVGLIFVDH